ncbi:MAG: hypothetical protein ABJA78_12320 [Ferruginibacter sp.]
MKEIINHIKGAVMIDCDTVLYGIISGDVIVINEANFIVTGMINGSITIEKKSAVTINGTLNGNINNSGNCKITGIVNGDLIKNGGRFNISSEALINKISK